MMTNQKLKSFQKKMKIKGLKNT